ncbi:MAG: hypothetical protein HOO06_02130 [Bdellovibrionaceae bacterium]|nr:hypothetical protein [Pseudobdellovibrionaceae bacterium]
MYDSNSNYLKIDYNKSKIKSVVDNNGRKLSFHYYKKGPQRNRLHYITGPKKIISKYKFDGDNLVENINQWGSKYTYKYDRLHNLTRINFPDKTFKALSYNQKRDWVTSFTHRDKCKETYDYKVNKKNKAGHYWSTVKKVCGKEVTNNSKYEFVYKFKKASKNKFLYKVNSKINGNETKITYHEVFGKPTFINRNGFLTKYNYFKNGFVKTKKENYRHFEFSYDKTCNKVSAMKTKYFIDKKTKKKAKKQKKLFKLVKSLYKYKTPKCNLVYAKDSSGQTVNISYDRTGRIKKITDQSKKIVHLKYDKKYGKPSYIARPGLGSINISYNKNGEIKDVKSKDGPQVATQVATVFNVLLELISPATAELTL